MDKEQLGFDPTIVESNGVRYMKITRDDQNERLVLDTLMRRGTSVVGRATTCWKAYREGDESKAPLVIKDSWQYPERDQEGELLREATEKEVENVARYYHYETVQGGRHRRRCPDQYSQGAGYLQSCELSQPESENRELDITAEHPSLA